MLRKPLRPKVLSVSHCSEEKLWHLICSDSLVTELVPVHFSHIF